MRRCMEGEAWFCNLHDVIESLFRLVDEPRITSSKECITLEHSRLKASICQGTSGRIGPIEYSTCRIEIYADPQLCPKVKIILMRGGG
ncbi:MAG: hypothetical protein F7B18_04655 [Desulfurococcales archaeon]|nr:hypothetical protein [Desulfurococcales archaeon]